MPPNTAIIYILEKHRHETQFEIYVTDMLWAQVNGMVFEGKKRYAELIERKQEESDETPVTRQSVKKHFLSLMSNPPS